jgi:hypothetical protein
MVRYGLAAGAVFVLVGMVGIVLMGWLIWKKQKKLDVKSKSIQEDYHKLKATIQSSTASSSRDGPASQQWIQPMNEIGHVMKSVAERQNQLAEQMASMDRRISKKRGPRPSAHIPSHHETIPQESIPQNQHQNLNYEDVRETYPQRSHPQPHDPSVSHKNFINPSDSSQSKLHAHQHENFDNRHHVAQQYEKNVNVNQDRTPVEFDHIAQIESFMEHSKSRHPESHDLDFEETLYGNLPDSDIPEASREDDPFAKFSGAQQSHPSQQKTFTTHPNHNLHFPPPYSESSEQISHREQVGRTPYRSTVFQLSEEEAKEFEDFALMSDEHFDGMHRERSYSPRDHPARDLSVQNGVLEYDGGGGGNDMDEHVRFPIEIHVPAGNFVRTTTHSEGDLQALVGDFLNSSRYADLFEFSEPLRPNKKGPIVEVIEDEASDRSDDSSLPRFFDSNDSPRHSLLEDQDEEVELVEDKSYHNRISEEDHDIVARDHKERNRYQNSPADLSEENRPLEDDEEYSNQIDGEEETIDADRQSALEIQRREKEKWHQHGQPGTPFFTKSDPFTQPPPRQENITKNNNYLPYPSSVSEVKSGDVYKRLVSNGT